MNLLSDPWLPVVRRSGARLLIRPAELTDGLDDDPIVAPATPRPDFDGAVWQFLIGLLQTAFAPADDKAWSRRYDAPPTPAELDAVFMEHRAAFELFGDGPRFMQDLQLDPASTSPSAVRQLLIDAPGDNTLKNNADIFMRGDQVEQMGPGSAALALFTLQINAPSGGAGHRTGLRGGGPLTTMLMPAGEGTMWGGCWLNVLASDAFETDQYGDPTRRPPNGVWPWLTETRTSEKKGGRQTTAADVHPAHVYWSTPRRIRLVESADEGVCDLDGRTSEVVVGEYATIPWGADYTGVWRHPLTPAVMTKKGERINRKMREGGLLWRDWPALTLGGAGSEPAAVITAHETTRRRRKRAELRVAAFGYDMDNMKARCWYRAEMPLIHVDADHRDAYLAAIRQIVDATTYADSVLGKAVLAALANRGTARGSALGDSVAGALWRETEAQFYTAARLARDALETGEPAADVVEGWHPTLTRAVLALFDRWIDIDHRIHVAPDTVITARRTLLNHLHGKKLRTTLGLPPRAAKSPSPAEEGR